MDMINEINDIVSVDIKKEVLSKLVFSQDMYDHIINIDICKFDLINIILASPVSILIKRDIFNGLLKYENKKPNEEYIDYESFYYHYFHINYIINKIDNLKDNEMLLMNMYLYNEDLNMNECWYTLPFTNYNMMMECAKKYDNYSYIILELYELKDNEYSLIGDLTIIKNEIIYFSLINDINGDEYDCGSNSLDFDLTIPFKKGDLLEIDCSPFIPEKQYVNIIKIDNENPYETIGILYKNKNNIIVDLKHGFIDTICPISPLIKMELVDFTETKLYNIFIRKEE